MQLPQVEVTTALPAKLAYCHGPDFAVVHNDRFANLLGARQHLRAWGQPVAIVMPP